MLTLLDISEIWSIIQRLNSNNLLTDKVAEKSPEQFTDHIEKTKKVSESQKWTFHKGQN